MAPAPRPGIRLAELVAVLSLGTDLGLGQPMEHVLRQCRIAMRLAERIGVDDDTRAVVYYTALLAWVGCHVDAHEQAKWFGDDLEAKGDARLHDLDGGARELRYLASRLGAGLPPLERVRLGFAFLVGEGRRAADAMFHNHWLATESLAKSLGLGDAVRDCLEHAFERWDGKGMLGLRGRDIAIGARLTSLADVVVVYHRHDGAGAAIAAARARSGTQFDPALVGLFAEEAPELLAELEATSSWDAVIASEPQLERRLPERDLDSVLEAVADFTDLKCPFALGHSRRVADLAADAAAAAGLPAAEATAVRRAGLLQDLGRLGVPNTVWDKPGTLTQAEWERVRLHPYLTGRMLSACPALRPLAPAAARHHERMDGSGYPHGLGGGALTPEARLLAAADTYAALCEPRPHRAPLGADEAAAVVRDEVRAGRLDGHAAEAVLRAGGHRPRARQSWPAGLTAREVEVLRLAARGHSATEIARRLVISRKTARNHLEHIYAKAGVSNRAQASLFAVRHGLMDDVAPAAA